MRLPLPQFSNPNPHSDRFAEVIETSTLEFLAQCLEPEDLKFPVMPPFGSWVKAKDEESGNIIFAVVMYVTTSPIDSVHRARALGLSLEELREQQPQIFAMLKTEFRALIVGFEKFSGELNGNRQGTIFQYLPPRPPQIHQAVSPCTEDEVIRFSENLDFLRILLQANNVPPEALISASLRQVFRLRKGDRTWLIKAGRALGVLLENDYDRLRYIISQIHFIPPNGLQL